MHGCYKVPCMSMLLHSCWWSTWPETPTYKCIEAELHTVSASVSSCTYRCAVATDQGRKPCKAAPLRPCVAALYTLLSRLITTCMLTEALHAILYRICWLTETFPACLQLGFYGFNPGTMGQIIATDGTDFAIVSNNRPLCMPFAAIWLSVVPCHGADWTERCGRLQTGFSFHVHDAMTAS